MVLWFIAGDVANTDINIGAKDAESQQNKVGGGVCKSKPKPRQQHQKMESGTDFIKRNIEVSLEFLYKEKPYDLGCYTAWEYVNRSSCYKLVRND